MQNGWRWYLAGGAGASAAYFLLPDGGVASTAAYDAIGLISGLAILVAVRLHRPARPAMWYWFSAGQIMSVLGDFTFGIIQVLHGTPYPSIADIFYLGSYPVTFTGLVLLARRSRGRTLAGLLDAAIVATGLGLAFWIFVLHPIAGQATTSTLTRLVGVTYPTVDLLLLAALARLLTGPGGRSVSTRMLGLAVTLCLVADVSYSVMTFYTGSDGHPADLAYLLSYVCWAVAAMHPSMAAPPTGDDRPPARATRLLAFGASALLAPALLLLPRVSGNAEDRTVVILGATLLFLLVLARMAGFMREIQQLALTDPLTGLANRARLEHAAPAEIVLLGLSGFKNVNDELGRPIGDQVLIEMAARLRAAAPAGALIARIGGDEFAITGADPEVLGEALRRPVTTGGHDLLVGVGIGRSGPAGAPVSELIRRAEVAMHAAKTTGEPFRCWTAALDERTAEHTRLGAELRTALDQGQFRVVYQPIVALPSARVHAVEALVRWDHPVRGEVGPVHFIPVAEQNGLIVELGAWILHTACAQLVEWRATLGEQAPRKVSVNVSARQLARPGFPATVAATLAATGLPAECLTVEVTETAVFAGGQAVTALQELRACGVGVALDDFGTGHSSLGLLQTVPVDVLKVDKSFVDRVTEAGEHAVIAEALIQVAGGLGLTAVAEGVETAEQAEALYARGYRYLQGYFYGRPAECPDFSVGAPVALSA